MDAPTVLQIRHAKRLSIESQLEFRAAHVRGMAQLRAGDVRGLIEAIDDELRAIDKQQEAIDLVSPKRRNW